MRLLQLRDRARVALRDCLGLEAGEALLVIEDGTLSSRLRQAFVLAAEDLGATPLTLGYVSDGFLSMREFGLFAGASLEAEARALPPPALHAIAAADAAVILNSDLGIMFDQGFTEACAAARVACGPYFTEEAFLRLMPESVEEVEALQSTTERVGRRLLEGRHVEIRSAAGTDLQMRIGEHRVNWSTGVHEQGKGYGGLEIWPGGQISTVPVAGSSRGRVVIDRSVNAPEYRELLDPVVLTVEQGYVTNIEGGAEAGRLAQFLAGIEDDGDAYHLTELGVGTNWRCKLAGVAAPAEDTHTAGCVSLALGADVHLGGDTRAGCHVDMTMHAATLLVDERIVVQDGVLSG